MSYEKTWTFAINNYGAIGNPSPPSGNFNSELDSVRAGYCPWVIYTALTGNYPGASSPTGAWTLEASSNGVSFNTTGTNILTAGTSDWSYDSTKWKIGNFSGNGEAHSWFVLKSPTSGGLPGGPYYMLCTYLSFLSPNFDGDRYKYLAAPVIYLTKTQPNYASASISVDPALASDAVVFDSTGFGLGTVPCRNFMFSGAANITTYYARPHFALATDGSFMLSVTKDGTLNVNSCLMVGTTKNLPLTDTYTTVGFNAPAFDSLTSIQAGQRYWRGWDMNGNPRSYSALIPVSDITIVANAWTPTTIPTVSFPVDDYTGNINTFPCYLYCPENSHKHIKGQLVDIPLVMGESSTAIGTSYPSGSIEHIAMHPFWMPSNIYPTL